MLKALNGSLKVPLPVAYWYGGISIAENDSTLIYGSDGFTKISLPSVRLFAWIVVVEACRVERAFVDTSVVKMLGVLSVSEIMVSMPDRVPVRACV